MPENIQKTLHTLTSKVFKRPVDYCKAELVCSQKCSKDYERHFHSSQLQVGHAQSSKAHMFEQLDIVQSATAHGLAQATQANKTLTGTISDLDTAVRASSHW